MTTSIKCPYCGNPAKAVQGDKIYPHRRDLSRLWFWSCQPCDAYVGCHRNGDGKQPLGRLANAELRAAKQAAHQAFDPLWRDGSMSRTDAYRKLARDLGITPSACHIGMFDVPMCLRVVALFAADDFEVIA